jgi:hypothetical protein
VAPFYHPFHGPYYPYHYYGHYPYHPFRPWLNLGFGLWLGYPYYYGYPYPYYYYGYPYYGSPYAYPYGSSYVYPNSSSSTPSAETSVAVPSGNANVTTPSTGALSFDVSPPSAEVWVDGNFIGAVGDFAPAGKPLELTSGRHAVEIRASGYHTVTFEVDVIAGQVMPYRGTMQQE